MSYRNLPMSIIDQIIVTWADEDTGAKVQKSVFIHKGGHYEPGINLFETLSEATLALAEITRNVRAGKIEYRENVRAYRHPDKTYTVEVP